MSVKNHRDYKEEVKRLDYTRDYIKMTLDATEEYRRIYKENIKDAMTELDYLDSSQSYINIILNTKFMETAEKNFDNLWKVKDKPYFARVDFKKKGNDTTDNLYIGKTSLMRAEDEVPLIVDWRSPIANIYYEGRLGEVSYDTEVGTEEGEVLLKRQFTIEDGKLESILDIDITTNDSFLQSALDANVDNRLKDIASTIQAEQNRVIRSDMAKALIVQGVAGSGKTTIALHRIAYFIYTYGETFDPENFMILAPNKLFINYISEVLPELGVEDVKQTTFIDFMVELIGNKYKLSNQNETLMKLIKGDTYKETELLKWLISFKGSLELKNIIDGYVKDIEEDFVPAMDFRLGDYIMISYEEIKKMFMEDFGYLPLYKRIKELKTTLNNRVKYRKKEALEETEQFYNSKIDILRATMEETEERRQQIVSLIDERDNSLKEIKSKAQTLLKKYLSNFPSKDLFEYYANLVTNEEELLKYSKNNLTNEQAKYLAKKSKELLDKKKIELEDYAPLAYMKHKILGFDKSIRINSVVIDEAQDFSLLQFYVLKNILKTNMFTILGDISQGIHSYRAIDTWEEVIDKVFGEEDTNYMTLVQSYRTTVEIMDFANEIIKKLNNDRIVLAKPVIRHGDKPVIHSFKIKEDLVNELDHKIAEMKKHNYKSIALICKTTEECESLKKMLDKRKNIKTKILTEKEERYEGGIVLVPSHLAKGLEFDVVFILSIEEKFMANDLDIKLLYVAATRALHQLFIFQLEGNIQLIDN